MSPPLKDAICRLHLDILLPFPGYEWPDYTWLQRRLGNVIFILEGQVSSSKSGSLISKEKWDQRKSINQQSLPCAPWWWALLALTISSSLPCPDAAFPSSLQEKGRDHGSGQWAGASVTSESKHRRALCSCLHPLPLIAEVCGRGRCQKAKAAWVSAPLQRLLGDSTSCRGGGHCVTETCAVHMKPPKCAA